MISKNKSYLCIRSASLFVLSFLAFSKTVIAAPTAKLTYTANASAIGANLRQLRVNASGNVFVMDSAKGVMSFSTDGTTATTYTYKDTIDTVPNHVNVDFVIRGSSLYIATSAGSNSRLLRFDVSGTDLNQIATLSVTGSGSVCLAPSNNIYSTRSSGARTYDSTITEVGSATTLTQAVSRCNADSSGNFYYVSTSGNLRVAPDRSTATDTLLTSGLGNAVDMRSLSLSPNTSGIYVGYTSSIRKFTNSGTLLWTHSILNGAGMDIDSSGNIYWVDTSGTIKVLNPINSVSDLVAEGNGGTIDLSWTTGVSDNDYSGVTIRRSTSSFPTSPTDGTAVTSDLTDDTEYTDTGLAASTTYYYTVFNKTSDGFYDVGSQISTSTEAPPSAPSSVTASASGDTITLNWTNPVSNFDSVIIRRGTSGFPSSISDGTAVQSGVTDETYSDTGLDDGLYYYSLFATDGLGLYSTAATASATVDATPTAAISNLTSQLSGTNILLSWTNPNDIDFASVTIRRSSTAFPTTINSDDLVAANITDESVTDADVDPGTYYYSLFAIDTHANASTAANITVTHPGIAPSVTTNTATEIDDTSALLSGTTTNSGTSDISTIGFEYGETTSYDLNEEETGLFTTGSFDLEITDLDCETLYHFRAYATNETDTTYGEDKTFTTSACTSEETPNASQLIMTVQAPTSKVQIKSNAIFVVTVRNPQGSNLENTIIDFSISSNMIFVSAEIIASTPDANVNFRNATQNQLATCTGSTQISCNVGTIPATTTVTLNITVQAVSVGPMSLGAVARLEGESSSSGSSTTTTSSVAATDSRSTGGANFAGCSLNKKSKPSWFAMTSLLVSTLILALIQKRAVKKTS